MSDRTSPKSKAATRPRKITAAPTSKAKTSAKADTNAEARALKGAPSRKRATAAPKSRNRAAPSSASPSSPLANPANAILPQPFAGWFDARGWGVRDHQLALLDRVASHTSTLLIAPTGAGKTLAGFLPSLVALSSPDKPMPKASGLHTLYLSPLKALAVDVARNILTPIDEMGLDVRVETRTGDTPAARRTRQRKKPPEILLTTPEQLALLLAHEDAPFLFGDLETVIIDELHAFAGSKRGDLMSLDLARLRTLRPKLTLVGLSATVARPSELRAYLSPQTQPQSAMEMSDLVQIRGGAKPKLQILELDEPVPWSGHSARYAMPEIYKALKSHRLSLVFVNTRMQAEMVFQELWRINDDTLRIALHHGSLAADQRRKVEAAMSAGTLDAVVATSTLDLGIDWGDVDLVVNIGAPKGASRLTQRIGRANHRMDEPSEALLIPSNRFEVLECRAALDAANAGANDAGMARTGGLDVLAQHVFGMACQAPFDLEEFYREVRSAAPYANLTQLDFERVVDFVATGGYALRAYDRFARLTRDTDGRMRLSHPRLAQTYRMNVGTIVDTPQIKLRLVSAKTVAKAAPQSATRPFAGRAKTSAAASAASGAMLGGRVLGEVDEYFIEQLKPGDTFAFAGEVLQFAGMRGIEAFVARAAHRDPMIPSYAGGKFPMSTYLAERVRSMLADRDYWTNLPGPVAEWLALQEARSIIPGRDEVLVETFPRGKKHFLVAYPFEGRMAHQTLGMLLTRRMERAGTRPFGFVANDYGLSIWGRGDTSKLIADGRLNLDDLFSEDMLGDDLDAWLAESQLMKKTFRHAAVIAGLIERRHPGREKSGRQVTMSTDLVYDVLRKHDPGHVLLDAAWADAAEGLLDIGRLGDFLKRIKGHIRHRALSRVSPLSVPILLEMGKESVGHLSKDDLLREAAGDLIAEAMAP